MTASRFFHGLAILGVVGAPFATAHWSLNVGVAWVVLAAVCWYAGRELAREARLFAAQVAAFDAAQARLEASMAGGERRIRLLDQLWEPDGPLLTLVDDEAEA